MIEEIEQKIKNAMDAVNNLSEPYKLEAFKIILNDLLQSNVIIDNKSETVTSHHSVGTQNVMTKLAEKCSVQVDELKNIVDYENDKFVLLQKINDTTDVKKQVTACQLIVTSYMKGADREWTKGSELRELVEKNGLGEPKNLSTNLSKSGFFRTRGEAKATEYSLTTEGWQQGIQLLYNFAKNIK